MKIAQCLKGVILASGVMFAGVAMAEGDAAIGEKIYQRALGSGCGKCHDVQSNPNLFESVKKLSRDEFKAVMDKGRNGMPPITAAGVMSLPFVKAAGLTEDQAVDSLIAYLKKGK